MALHPALISFRDWLVGRHRPDGRFESIQALEGADTARGDLEVRLYAADRSYYEVRVDLAAGEVQAGFATESRIVNESIEQMVLDNGGNLDEILGDELCDLKQDPLPMEHFFERPAFRFIVRMRLEAPESLADSALRQRVTAVLEASLILFQDCVDSS